MSKNNDTQEEVENVTIEITESEDQIQEMALLNDEYKSKQLKRFDTAVSDAAIAELKEIYLPLKVTSVDDKAIVKRIREGRLKARGFRLGVVKLAENIIEAPKNFIKAVNDRRDEIVEELKSFERLTQEQEDLFGQLKIEADEKREKELQEKFDARLARLVELKMEFAGDRYVLGTDAHITNMEIADFSDAEFDAFIDNIKPIAADIIRKKEAAKQFEERKISLRQMGFADNSEGIWSFYEVVVDAETVQTCDDEAFEAILARAKVVADRVKQEMEDFREKQEKLKKDQQEMEKQKLQMAAQKLALRQDQLKALGMTILENGSASHEVDFMDKSQIESLADDQFAEWCNDFRASYVEYQKEVELKNRNLERVAQLVEIGCKIISNKEDIEKEVFYIKGPLSVNETTERGDIYAASDEEFAEIVKTFKWAAEKKAEEEAIVERTNRRVQELASRGFKTEEGVYNLKYFVFGDYSESEFLPENCLTITRTQLDIYTDEQWNDLILEATAFQKSKTENELLWQQFQDKEKEKAAEIRRTALLPDKKKLIEFSAKVAALWKEMPEMDTAEGKNIAERQLAAVKDLAHTIKAEAEAMS